MKKGVFSTVRTIILSLLVAAAFAMVIPVYNYISNRVNLAADMLRNVLEENLGLEVSYDSLSPSILSTILIRGITISTKKADDAPDSFIRIEKTKINFNLPKLLRKNFNQGLSSVVIDGIDVDVDELMEFLDYVSKKMEKLQEEEEVPFNFDLKTILQFIPASIKLKNINLRFKSPEVDAYAFFKEIKLDNKPSRSTLVFDLDAEAGAQIAAIERDITCNLNVTGTIYNEVNNSNFVVKLSDLTDGNMTLKHLSLLASYHVNEDETSHKVELQTIQSLNPISLNGEYDFERQQVTARLRMQKMNPLSIISMKSSPQQLLDFKNFMIDMDTEVKVGLSDMSINYDSKGNVYVPPKFFPHGINVGYSLNGNTEKIHIRRLNLNGQILKASADLSLVFKTLQASGSINLDYFKLDNGKQVSTELFIDPLNKGFMAFAPQVEIGDKLLTALQVNFMPQKDSYDFSLEASDYSHFDYGSPGIIKLDGSYLTKSNYLQASLSLTEMFVDSLLDYGCQVVPEEVANGLSGAMPATSPFVVSADAYVSTDFKTGSFNLPYIVLANTKGENQVLMVSADGNLENISINQLNLVYGNYALTASGGVDISPENGDILYTADLNFSSVPYHISGSVIKNVITVSGDYSLLGQVAIGNQGNISGFLGMENFPVNIPLGSSVQSIIISLNSDFSYDSEKGPEVTISRFEVEDLSTDILPSARISTKGNVNKYGAQLTTLNYRDDYYLYEGNADVTINFAEEIFSSAGVSLKLKNPLDGGYITLEGSVSNPEEVMLDASTILSSLYLNAEMDIRNFSLNRFAGNSNKGNILNATAFATGTLEHPFVALNLEKASMLMGTMFMNVKGSVVLEDRDISVDEFDIDLGPVTLSDTHLNFSLENMEGSGNCMIRAGMGDMNVQVPLDISVYNIITGKKGLDSLSLTVGSKSITGSLLKKPVDFELMGIYANKNFALYSSKNLGLTGFFSTSGILQADLNNGSSLKAGLNCTFGKAESNISLSKVNIDVAALLSYLNFDQMVNVKNCVLSGNFTMKGNLTDPDFEGTLKLLNPVINVPFAFNDDLTSDEIVITGNDNEIHIQESGIKLKNKKKLLVSADMIFNNGAVNNMKARIRTVKNEQLPLHLNTDFFTLDGKFVTDITADILLDDNVMSVSGYVGGESVNVSSGIFNITNGVSATNSAGKQAHVEQKTVSDPMKIIMDLTVSLGTHSSINFDPLLRCVFVPNTKVKVVMDSSTGVFNIDGQLGIKSGDIAYLNRNFYIKEGHISFNPANIVNSRITFSAEARERDDKGQNVKLMLSAEDQQLSNLNPKITSDPPKSEKEIRTMLGQLFTGDVDSASNLLVSAGDYAVQSLFLRQAENKLRDLLNFDIFSVRTNVLQNSLNQTINNPGKELTLSNLLDNSTVYIGKYLGNSIYFDAMLQATFEDNFNFDFSAPSGLLLPLELGLELEAPFGNIRWNLSQDLNDLFKNHAFSPTASVSLSWKWRF